ncbi:AMP-binding protein [Nocardioides sp. Iso805N]|uniref:AMP-binding protein n=1 Tax=Nocardioides sp. Iso805N TaxID=1283287 RepID=UPI000377D516|nr:AMP-binding protein [Nocardioides sp. Iso805N]
MILRPSAALAKAVSAGSGVRVLAGSGVVKPFSPTVLARLAKAVHAWGLGPAGGFTMLATRYPDRVGIVDELGEITYGEIHRRTNVLARALAARGVGEGDGVAVMCRNHRGFVEATVAIAKLGADALYLNTAFAGPQLVDVLAREKPRVVIHDEEFTGLLAGAEIEQRVIAWTDSEAPSLQAETLDALATDGDDRDLTSPSRHGRIIILTSGTTGTPKGAPRNEAGIDAAISLLSRMPLKEGWRTHIAAPLFHTWGFAHLMLAMLLGSTMVLRRRFDPAEALEVTQGCDSLVVIPVMLQRMLTVEGSFDLSSLQVVASSGSALPGDLALEWMDRFGENLYNIYGSTEVAYASIATPGDLRSAPTSAGKPPWGTVVRILDPVGREVPPGEPGRIFVGNSLLFEGYTGGGAKEVVDGLMSSGDVGRFDAEGRLYVEGRDDEMIVSGGENVFPKEVEDCLARHPDVVEVACVGVDDPEFGKRLRAFVVVSGEAGEDDLKGWVKDHLARFKVPREIVVLPELPRNATGKVLKRELLDWLDTAGEGTA